MTIDVESSNKGHPPRSRRSHRRPLQEQRFSSYLTFGFQTTLCLAIFLILYILVLLALSPLLSEEAPKESHMQRGQVFKPVVDPLMQKLKNVPRMPSELLAEEVAGTIKKRIHNFRQQEGMTDASLMEKAAAEMEHIRKRRQSSNAAAAAAAVAAVPGQLAPGKRAGFIVLGMHRSGTSMLSGLLVQGCGYHVGGPLIGTSFDNEKGFFERIDAVLQNDEFLKLQGAWWGANLLGYKSELGVEHKKSGEATFKEGAKALAFLNNAENAPWLQKDPRMCITLRTWLPLLNNEPAVLFTYRHPLQVAKSLVNREKAFTMEHGLRLWIVYNMRALQNSADLCRVYTSNDAILAKPLEEVQRLSNELTTKCGLPAAPSKITQEDVDKFVDPNLQHNKKKAEEGDVIANYDGCQVREFKSSLKEGTPDFEREHELYLKAMKIYCDLESGAAYKDGYEWPSLT